MSRRRRGLALALVLLTSATVTARADQLDRQVAKLHPSQSYKVRLSAALVLAKSTEVRAVEALATALVDDDEATIRNVAALALGKNVDAATPKATRDHAISALTEAASDRDDKVRDNAARSLTALEALRAVAETPIVFVNIDMPSDLSKLAPASATREMRAAVRAVFGDRAPSYAIDWKSGALPTRAELDAEGARGYYVGASVSSIEVTKKAGRGEVKCSVSIRVNPWQGRDAKEKWESSKSASASGSGRAIGGVSAAALATSMEDCVVAVAEQVTTKQVVPFIRKLASP